MIVYDPGTGDTILYANDSSNGVCRQYYFNWAVSSTGTDQFYAAEFIAIANFESGHVLKQSKPPPPWLVLAQARPFKSSVRPAQRRARFLDRELRTKTFNRRFV